VIADKYAASRDVRRSPENTNQAALKSVFPVRDNARFCAD